MKKYTLILTLAISALFLFSSCEEDLFNISETLIFEHEFVVFTESDTFTNSRVVDLIAESDLVSQYGEKIKSIEIEQIRYWVKSHNGSAEQQVSSILLQVTNADGSDAQNLILEEALVLSNLVNNVAIANINNDAVFKLQNLTSAAPYSFGYLLNIDGNEVPYDFTLVVEVKAKLIANPLN